MIERLLEPRKPKLNINLDDYDLIQDDYSHYKSINDNEDGNIGNWNDFDKSNIRTANETNIYDPFDLHLPENVEKYKYATINEDEIDELFLGFVDKEPIKHKQLDNVYKFGNPTPEQFRLSNWQTEQGTSNRLNQQIMGIETNEDIEDIVESQFIGDKKLDERFKNEVDDIMTKLDKDFKDIDEKIEINKETLPKNVAKKENKVLKNMQNILKENTKLDINDVKEDRDKMKKGMKEKASIKPVIHEVFPNRKKKEIEIKKEEPEEFKEENPMNDEEEKIKKDIERKKVNEKRQQEINQLTDPIKTEKEELKKLNEIVNKIKKIDVARLDTKDPIRNELSSFLRRFGKNVGNTTKREAILKKVEILQPEIKRLMEKQTKEIKENENKKKEDQKISYSTPKAKTRTLNDLESPLIAEGKGKVKVKSKSQNII